jgi:hypothetical protein
VAVVVRAMTIELSRIQPMNQNQPMNRNQPMNQIRYRLVHRKMVELG